MLSGEMLRRQRGRLPAEKAKILLVDDLDDNLLALEALLAADDVDLLRASSGREALELLLVHEVALALIDVQMPEISGVELAELMRGTERTRHVPIILVTAGQFDQRHVFKGYEAGAADFLFKPIAPVILRNKVNTYLQLHRQNRQIASQLDRLQLIARATNDVLWDRDLQTGEIWWNDAMAVVFGHGEAGSGTDTAWWETRMHPDDRERVLASQQDVWTSAMSHWTAEYRFRLADGGYADVLDRASVVRDSQGRAVRMIGAMLDLTERKRVEVERQQAADELQRTLMVREEFLSIASHELKTPLTAAQLNLATILRRLAAEGEGEVPAPVLHGSVTKVDRQVTRLAKLVNDLLDVTRLASGRLHLDIEPIDLTELVGDVVARFGDEAASSETPVLLQAPPTVLGHWDRSRLEQVVTNMVSNAVKYGAGRPVHVAVQAEGDQAVVCVQDQGIGIDPADQERLFQRFERLVSARHYGGFGLGLWIVSQNVAALGGTVAVASELGQGATFTVRLPLAGPPEPDDA